MNEKRNQTTSDLSPANRALLYVGALVVLMAAFGLVSAIL